jgi:hypothetical protein
MERRNDEDIRLKKYSIVTEKDWLIRAVEQKHPHLTVGVAYSEPLVYDRVDRLLLMTAIRN